MVDIASTNTYVHVPVTFFHSKQITKVRSLPYVSLLRKASTRTESLWRKTRIRNGSALFRFVSLHTYKPQPWPRVRIVGGATTWIVHTEVIMKNVAITKLLSRKFTFMCTWFLAISRKFWTTEIWRYTVSLNASIDFLATRTFLEWCVFWKELLIFHYIMYFRHHCIIITHFLSRRDWYLVSKCANARRHVLLAIAPRLCLPSHTSWIQLLYGHIRPSFSLDRLTFADTLLLSSNCRYLILDNSTTYLTVAVT